MKRTAFLLLAALMAILTGAFTADARNILPLHRSDARQEIRLPGEAPGDPVRSFIRQETLAGHLDGERAPAYEQALAKLPFREDMLPCLGEKHPAEMRRTLESLVRGERSFVGPFVCYSVIHNYEQVLTRHVDLRPVLDRIRSGSLREDRDGWKVFNNYEKLLPRRPRGWYHEVRVRTEGLRGPGPQRLVYGEDGEVYYTPDHYKSFHLLEVRYK